MNRVVKYAGVSVWCLFVAAFSIETFNLNATLNNVLKTIVIFALVHMFVFSFCIALSAQKRVHKVLLILFALVFPAVSGVLFYFFQRLNLKTT